MLTLTTFIASALLHVAPPSIEVPRDELVRIAGTKVSLLQPEGFAPAGTFAGLQHESSGSSILVTSIPGSLVAITDGLTEAGLRRGGMELLELDDHPYDEDTPGVLMELEQEAQHIGTIQKWMWVFGTDSESVMITANVIDESLSDIMREVVVGAVWERDAATDPEAELGFRLRSPGEFGYVMSFGATLAYGIDEDMDKEQTGRPFLVVGPAMAPVDFEGDRKGFAEARAKQQTNFTAVKVQSSKAVSVDDLDGYEVVARGVAKGDPVTLYVVLLFDGSSYWVAQGTVRSADADEYLPKFKAAVESFERARVEHAVEGFALTAPTGWTEREVAGLDADLFLGNVATESYVTVIAEDKQEYADEDGTLPRLDQLGSLIVEMVYGECVLENGPRRVQVGERDGVEYVLRSQVNGTDIGYVLTILEGEERYYQVAGWTLWREFDEGRKQVDDVVATFREL